MMRWYVIQIYAGYEDVIKRDLEKRIAESEQQDHFGDILIPTAKAKQFFSATSDQNDEQGQQLFPGYMLIQMEANPQTIRLVTSMPRVFKFLGGNNPIALPQKEIDRVMGQISGKVEVAGQAHSFEVGSEVDIKEGPFAGFVGIIDTIDQENEKLTVMVSIFGRMTPVELRFDQIKH